MKGYKFWRKTKTNAKHWVLQTPTKRYKKRPVNVISAAQFQHSEYDQAYGTKVKAMEKQYHFIVSQVMFVFTHLFFNFKFMDQTLAKNIKI
jgi:hypothetical protein